MKLVHQINLAFGAALVLVLGITALLIHYVLLDHFIGSQKADMRSMGTAITAQLVSAQPGESIPIPGLPVDKTTAGQGDAIEVHGSGISTPMPVFTPTLTETKSAPMAAGVEAIVTDAQGNVLSEWPSSLESVHATLPATTVAKAGSLSMQSLWDGTDGRYLVEVNQIPQGTLTLLSPISKIKEIEFALLKQLLLIVGLSFVLMLMLSYFVTKKLIKPLMKLREELTKIKSRQFAQVSLVRAGGEIGSVAKTVYEMAGELNRFNRVQKHFFQNASHELKSPLMSIAGYAEGIRDGIFEGESVRKGLDIIVRESGRLKKIVTEMTLLAKLDSEEDIYKPAPVPLKELLTETAERVNPMLVKHEKSLHLACDAGLIVYADRDKLLQALLNVVANAIRHAGAQIRIEATLAKGQVVMTITDDGEGITEELLPNLFHRFVKGKGGETGLGLAISRAIVERSGGKLSAANGREGGAEFRFAFPQP
ncbi:integral membrane sensor signal transduction histidine kinase [Paenibacillus curdlanolyticus YK9]|uniref:histidine kinase n=1 Tax=Paenibacillus curdlanolyticus YK9 TaxID=717606 RepID=E0IG11_9BACL|nr:HAMP domain-containing sensor histidine kinase [Paenibacillus curdlanolyticus]EFM08591.1 integral membrane sensor signal transduction histidine kinase [Paenibacillus curdlanolyticus YK9]